MRNGVRSRRQRLSGLPINRILPNVLTLMALAIGLSAIRFGLQGRWELAVLAIVGAGILDGLDGRIARILKGSTKFGAELDSLSDFLCFGVAPALVLYQWALTAGGPFGWALVLVFCMACALRLARFNADLDEPDPPAWTRNFFVGVPTPAGAGLVLMPLVLWIQTGLDGLRSPWLVGPVILGVAALLVSRLRTYSFKRIKIAPRYILPTMLCVGLFLALLVSLPWITLTVTAVAYVVAIPLGSRAYLEQRRLQEADAEAAAPDAT
jgi:CDP-diacylglycerol--serine O-phosphatidyltransferase